MSSGNQYIIEPSQSDRQLTVAQLQFMNKEASTLLMTLLRPPTWDLSIFASRDSHLTSRDFKSCDAKSLRCEICDAKHIMF